MPELPAACAWPLLLLLAIQPGTTAGAPQPWHCAPCSAEKLALCPPVPDSCAEAAPPASCGCCPLCALPQGAACGVVTARCATGLSCRARPEEPRPLHALIRGQGVCGPSDPEAGRTIGPRGSPRRPPPPCPPQTDCWGRDSQCGANPPKSRAWRVKDRGSPR